MNEDLQKELQPIVDEIKTSVAETVTKAVTKEVVERMKDELPQRKDIFGGDDTKAKEKDVLEGKQKAAEFLKALSTGDSAQVKALSTGSAGNGGYFVPTEFSNEIIRLAPNYGVIRRNARNFPISSEGSITKLPTVGSVSVFRVSEGAAIPASAPTTGQTTITIKKLGAIVPMTNELLKDANVDTVGVVAQLVAEALAGKEDDWGFNGLAAGEGIFQNASVPVVTMATGNTTYAKVTADDAASLLSQLDESALPGAKFYMSFSVFNSLRTQKDTTGRYLIQEPGGGQPATLWNIPIEFVRVLPKTTAGTQAGTKFLAVGDLRYMLFADKRQYEAKWSDEATITDTDGLTSINLFTQDYSALRVTERIDIQLAEPTKGFAVLKTSAT